MDHRHVEKIQDEIDKVGLLVSLALQFKLPVEVIGPLSEHMAEKQEQINRGDKPCLDLVTK
jgi:hypothetical protein